jgi:hypothetical protein
LKRIVVTALWAYSFWMLGSMISVLAGVPDLLGPAFGLTAGVMVGLDPRHLFWARPAQSPSAPGLPVTA